VSVKDIAGRAYAAWEAAEQRRIDEAREAETRKAVERQQRARAVLDRSMLPRWFPNTTFNIVEYTGVGTSRQYQSDGSDIIVRSDDGVLFGLSYVSPTEIHVYCVELCQPSAAYAHEGAYYSGPRVKNPAEVGKALANRV